MDGFSFTGETRSALRVQPIGGIIRAVCEEYLVSQLELSSQRRSRHLVVPRHIAFWLCKELTLATYPEIGRMFGGRDHTTIMHGAKKIQIEVDAGSPIGQAALKLKGALQ